MRSVCWGTLYNLFVLGFFFTFPIVGLQYFIEKNTWGGHSLVLGSVLVAPLTEEIGKILPLVLLLAMGRLGFRNSYGACDLMDCGAALGWLGVVRKRSAGYDFAPYAFRSWAAWNRNFSR